MTKHNFHYNILIITLFTLLSAAIIFGGFILPIFIRPDFFRKSPLVVIFGTILGIFFGSTFLFRYEITEEFLIHKIACFEIWKRPLYTILRIDSVFMFLPYYQLWMQGKGTFSFCFLILKLHNEVEFFFALKKRVPDLEFNQKYKQKMRAYKRKYPEKYTDVEI